MLSNSTKSLYFCFMCIVYILHHTSAIVFIPLSYIYNISYTYIYMYYHGIQYIYIYIQSESYMYIVILSVWIYVHSYIICMNWTTVRWLSVWLIKYHTNTCRLFTNLSALHLSLSLCLSRYLSYILYTAVIHGSTTHALYLYIAFSISTLLSPSISLHLSRSLATILSLYLPL